MALGTLGSRSVGLFSRPARRAGRPRCTVLVLPKGRARNAPVAVRLRPTVTAAGTPVVWWRWRSRLRAWAAFNFRWRPNAYAAAARTACTSCLYARDGGQPPEILAPVWVARIVAAAYHGRWSEMHPCACFASVSVFRPPIETLGQLPFGHGHEHDHHCGAQHSNRSDYCVASKSQRSK